MEPKCTHVANDKLIGFCLKFVMDCYVGTMLSMSHCL